jgi:Putative restriction endonuclease
VSVPGNLPEQRRTRWVGANWQLAVTRDSVERLGDPCVTNSWLVPRSAWLGVVEADCAICDKRIADYQDCVDRINATLTEQHVSTHDSSRRADRVIWAGLGRAPNPRKDLPTIVVEFVSEGKRNRLRVCHEKRTDYLAAGVREYWIIDRFPRTLTACRGDSADVVVPHDGTYQTPLLPGFELPLARLLAVADSWRASKER